MTQFKVGDRVIFEVPEEHRDRVGRMIHPQWMTDHWYRTSWGPMEGPVSSVQEALLVFHPEVAGGTTLCVLQAWCRPAASYPATCACCRGTKRVVLFTSADPCDWCS